MGIYTMTSLSDMSDLDLQVHAGNVAYQIWARMPEPKEAYVYWYYSKREQSLSEALEKVRLTPEVQE
jgi:hypothetical protein